VKNGAVTAEGHPTQQLGLRARVTVAFAILALVLSVTLAVFSYELTRSFVLSRRNTTARQQTYLNARAVRDALLANPADVQGALAQAQTGAESAVVLRIANSWFGTSVGVGRRDVPASLRSLVASDSAGTQNTDVASASNIAVGVPLPAIDGAYFEFVPVQELELTLRRLAQVLAAAVVVVTLLGAVIGRYASGRVLRPVRRMADAASGISEGTLSERLDAEGDSDLEPLVDAFNDMVSALHRRIEREARFASDVSHELRTPLAKMSAALSVARRRNSVEATNAALEVLDDELQRFTGLVLDLLDISRMEAGVSELDVGPVDPAELVREVLTASRRDDVAVDITDSAPASVAVDKRRIGQILTNLLDNADAYGGGAKSVEISGSADSLRLAVDDSGPGVPLHEREYIFDRFARGQNASDTPGTGLGLALVVEHVRLHHGDVWVEDSPRGGARFVVRVPRNGT
jgi:signal transduction histidine kinase